MKRRVRGREEGVDGEEASVARWDNMKGTGSRCGKYDA